MIGTEYNVDLVEDITEHEFLARELSFLFGVDTVGQARLIKDAGGIPARGNRRSELDAVCRFNFAKPEHR
jgi:hypothetical protein